MTTPFQNIHIRVKRPLLGRQIESPNTAIIESFAAVHHADGVNLYVRPCLPSAVSEGRPEFRLRAYRRQAQVHVAAYSQQFLSLAMLQPLLQQNIRQCAVSRRPKQIPTRSNNLFRQRKRLHAASYIPEALRTGKWRGSARP